MAERERRLKHTRSAIALLEKEVKRMLRITESERYLTSLSIPRAVDVR